jgi:hypothetical protein
MVNVQMCEGFGEKGVFGVRQGAENGAVDLEHGAGMGRRSLLKQRATTPSKRAFLLCLSNHHTCIMFTMCLNVFSPLQVKNKPCDGDSEPAFILAPCVVRLQTPLPI